MHKSYEEYLLQLCGLEVTHPLPRRPEEYYWMLLIGETPPEDYILLPRRPLGYYLSHITGQDYSPSTSLESYMLRMAGEVPPEDTSELPRHDLGYYYETYISFGALLVFPRP